MSHYQHLNIEERESILVGIHAGKSIRQMGRELGRSASSISREIRRNYKQKDQYSAVHAHKKYLKRRKQCRRRKLLLEESLREVIQRLFLEHQWSPEQIANRLKREANPLQISYATIYRGIYGGLLDEPDKPHRQRGVVMKLRHKGKRRKQSKVLDKRGGSYTLRPLIDERPQVAMERGEIGHWEADTVNGKLCTGSVLTIVDRKSRFLLAAKLERCAAEELAGAMTTLLENISCDACKTITCDRGQEFRRFGEVREAVGINFFFSHPSSPWERPTNENTNGLLREYMPKRTDFSQFTDAHVQAFTLKLNLRPRKCLGWLSPFEVFFNTLLHLT